MAVTAQLPDAQARAAQRIRQVCDAVGEFIAYWGFKGILGRVWALCALHRTPLSQIEIADFFQVSRSLVSGAVAELVEHGLLRATSDHRNAPYEAVMDVWPTISDVLREREWMLLEQARVALDAAAEEVELAGAASGWDLARIRSLLRMTELGQSFLRLLIGLRVPRKLEGVRDWLVQTGKLVQSLRGLR
jgi:DNA-binding transcriptional regulator GbsR (MarR family)